MTHEERRKYMREVAITLVVVAVMWTLAWHWITPTLLGDDYAGRKD